MASRPRSSPVTKPVPLFESSLSTGLPALYVIIPVLNGWPKTQRCLQALQGSRCKDFRVVVVDHGSTDVTKTALPRDFPSVCHLLGDAGLWWAGATNLGIRFALKQGASHLLLLNNDCFVTPDTLPALAAHARLLRGRDAAVAPMQRDPTSGRLHGTGFTTCLTLGFPTLRFPPWLHSRSPHPALHKTRLIMGGRGVILPAGLLRRVGLLDELNLPHYLADHDFYLRCRKQGIALFIATDAQVDVDTTRTSLAAKPEAGPFALFLETLKNPRSHRNIQAQCHFFRKHYPLPGLYPLGVALNFLRYFILYLLRKITVRSPPFLGGGPG